MARYSVILTGGAPWGFRLKGDELGGYFTISKINPRSKAAHSGSIEVGDVIESINNRPTQNLDLKAVQDIIYNTKETLHIVLTKSSSLIPNGGTTMSSAEVIDTRLPTSVTSNSHASSSSSLDPKLTRPWSNQHQAILNWTNAKPPLPQPLSMRSGHPMGRRRMRTTLFLRPRSQSADASDRNRSPQQWRPVNYRPGQSKDDTADAAFSPPPVPPPPPGDATDTEGDDLPAVPPKPQGGGTNVWLSANTPMQGEVYSPSSPKSPIWQNGKPDGGLMMEDLTNQGFLGSKGAALFAKKKKFFDEMDAGADRSVIAPPPIDIMNNNKIQRDPWDDWLPPPPPDWQLEPAPPPSRGEPLTNGRESPTGVWQPGQTPEQDDEYNGHDNFQDLQPVWAPSSSQPAKKEFRSVRPPQQSQEPAPPPVMHHPVQQAPSSPVRKQPPSHIQRQHQPPVHTAVHHPATPQPTPSSPSRVPDPAQLPTGALYQKITIDGDQIHTDTYYPMEDKPKHETTNLNDETKQRIVQKAPTYEGIGPRDQESGMPLGLRQHVKEDNRHDWYKEMYKSIHKQDRDEDGNPLVASYEMTEPPTPLAGTADPNPYTPTYRFPDHDDASMVTSNPFDSQPSKPPADNPVVSTPVNRYRQQPRSIVDYEPGKSSLVGTERAPMEAQTVRQDYAAPPPQSHRSGYGSDDESRRAKQNLPVNQYPDKNNQGFTRTRSQYQYKSMSLPRGLPRHRSLRLSSEPGGRRLSAAERLGIKSPPPRRAPSLSSLEGLGASNISGKDKNYNYKNPPHTLDKASVQKIIDEEKKKRALADREIQDSRRHSDYTSTKGPIITDDRFKDILADAKPIIDNTSKKETRACAIALYSFSAQSPKELSFKKGDTLYLTKEIDRNWYKGEHHGRMGIFPRSYIEVVTSIDEARKNQLALPSKEGKAKAKFKFKGETQNELSFSKHDYIDLIRRVDGNWWEGRLGPRTGIFPDSYIEVLKHPEVVPSALSPTGSYRSPISPSSKGSHSPTRGPISPAGTQGGPHSPSSRTVQSPTRRSMNQQPARGQPMSPGRVPDERITQTQATPVQSQPMYQQKQHQPPRTQQYNPGVSQHPVSQSQHHQIAPSPHHGTAQTYTIDRQSPTPITRQPQDQYQAMYNYVPQNDDELELRDGDMVVVLEKCDDGWFVGTSLRTGMFGTFPGNYVTKA
ncbi:uncharacterized protein [Apostichopus japonicus]|uniref:uncharacterized protein isoform X5 n=1 Tax=Stichopus japonicus TaxID=307972 RepID=UPI003AB8120F